MRLSPCLLLFAALATAAPPIAPAGVALKASVAGHTLILNDIFLNGAGPFRMVLDTGNASSLVRPEVARRLNLKPGYAVELATIGRTQRVPVAILDEVRAGAVVDRDVEAMIGDVYQPGADGVLGANWLARHDYMLDYRTRRVALDVAPSAAGVRVPLSTADGRPVVLASIDGRPTELVIDSGAPAVVLYERPSAEATVVQAASNAGSARAERFTARLAIAGGREHAVEAYRIDVHGLGPGLLPARTFGSVFVSNREKYVEFVQ